MPRKYPRVTSHVAGDSVTQQQFKESTDINNIVARYTRSGIDPNPGGLDRQQFGFASSQDFTESAFRVAEVHSAFAALPSAERSAFDNDPSRWIEHISKPIPPDEKIVETEPSQTVSEETEKAPETPPNLDALDII